MLDSGEKDPARARSPDAYLRQLSGGSCANSTRYITRAATTYTCDEANHVALITPPSGSALSFSVDALGRQWK